MSDYPYSFYSQSRTAANDSPFRVCEDINLVLSSVNIYAYSNDVDVTNQSLESSILRANAVIWFDGTIKPFDFLFKNHTAGSNAQVVIQGIVKR